MAIKRVDEPDATDLVAQKIAEFKRHDPLVRERWTRVILGALSLTCLVGVYALFTSRPANNGSVTPTIGQILASLVEALGNGQLASAVGASLERVLIGYAIGTTAAVIIGSLMGWFRYFDYFFDPVVEVMRPIPPLAYIPLILIWFGIGELSRVTVITLACFVTCIINVVAGMKEIPRVYVDAAMTLGACRMYIFRTVALPATVPFIFTGLRIALAAAWTSLVAAEMLAAQDGLGFLLQTGRQYFQTSQVMYVIATIGFLAFLMDRIFRSIQKRLTAWSESIS